MNDIRRSGSISGLRILGMVMTLLVSLVCSPYADAQNALIIWDVNDSNTQALATALTNAGITVTMSATNEIGYDGTNPSPAGFDAIIHLNGTTYNTEMASAGQAALVAYVQNGGGFIHGEWNAYEILNSRMLAMRELTLFDRSYGLGGPLTYNVVPTQLSLIHI